MRPDTDWGSVAADFKKQQGGQSILCVRCLRNTGDTTPPKQVLIANGESFCLDHFMGVKP
jgi:hypothetical protein